MTKCVDPVFAGKEVDRTHLEIGEELGKGSFGVVFKGLVYGLDGNQKYTPVAVKSLRGRHITIHRCFNMLDSLSTHFESH